MTLAAGSLTSEMCVKNEDKKMCSTKCWYMRLLTEPAQQVTGFLFSNQNNFHNVAIKQNSKSARCHVILKA